MSYTKLVGAYLLTHVTSGHFLVGSSDHFAQTLHEHNVKLRDGQHELSWLQTIYKAHPEIKVTQFLLTDNLKDAEHVVKCWLELFKNDPLLLNDSTVLKVNANRGSGAVPSLKAAMRTMEQPVPKAREHMGREERARLRASKKWPVSIQGTIYPSVRVAAQATGYARSTINLYINSTHPGHAAWFRIEPAKQGISAKG